MLILVYLAYFVHMGKLTILGSFFVGQESMGQLTSGMVECESHLSNID